MSSARTRTRTRIRPTDRELKILHMLASGLRDDEIGAHLGLSTDHVKHLVTNMRREIVKFASPSSPQSGGGGGGLSRPAIVAVAIREGWIN